MSFNRPSLSELIDRARRDIESRLPGADALLRHSVLDVLARVHAAALSALYGYADWIARQILPDTAEGESLARHAAIWGVARKAAVPARGPVVLTGADGAVAPAGARLARIDGALFELVSEATIAGGTATVQLEARDAGPDGDTEAGRAITFISPLGGISASATVGPGGIGGGAADESDEGLLGRLLERIQKPPHGGSKADYHAWALAQPGVTRAWVFPLWLGAGTVGLTFVMDDRIDIIPAAPDVAAVQAALDLVRPVTAELIVFAPAPHPVDVAIASAPASVEVHDAIVAELRDMFARDAEPGGVIRKSRISEAISIASGENYHDLIAPAGDVASGPAELPVLGAVTWS